MIDPFREQVITATIIKKMLFPMTASFYFCEDDAASLYSWLKITTAKKQTLTSSLITWPNIAVMVSGVIF